MHSKPSSQMDPHSIKGPQNMGRPFSTHSLAACFLSIEMIIDSLTSLGQWPLLQMSEQISNSSLLHVHPNAFRISSCFPILQFGECFLKFIIQFIWSNAISAYICWFHLIIRWFSRFIVQISSIYSFRLLCICLFSVSLFPSLVIYDICWPPLISLW